MIHHTGGELQMPATTQETSDAQIQQCPGSPVLVLVRDPDQYANVWSLVQLINNRVPVATLFPYRAETERRWKQEAARHSVILELKEETDPQQETDIVFDTRNGLTDSGRTTHVLARLCSYTGCTIQSAWVRLNGERNPPKDGEMSPLEFRIGTDVIMLSIAQKALTSSERRGEIAGVLRRFAYERKLA